MKLLIKGGNVINADLNECNGIYDVLVEDGIIKKISEGIDEGLADQVVDASGKCLMPGFIDLHVHFREPGFTHKETVKTGSMAAARGGYTSVFCMPNTKPVIDSAESYKLLEDIISKDAVVNVHPVGAVTKGQNGEELAEIEKMASLGMLAISEDGKSVMDSAIYRKAMKIAKNAGVAVFAHCEDINLVEGGVMNAGHKADEMGFKGISNAVEDIIAARDILLAKETGVKLHLCHCSTKDSVTMLRMAKEEGLDVTGEVCPHHFTLTDEDIKSDDSNYKMNPPLRSREDVEALKDGIAKGYVTVISTDHAPHSAEEKAKSIKDAPFGIVGLETSFALSYTELVKSGLISVNKLVECMSINPAKVAGIDRGVIKEGAVCDIAITDTGHEYKIDKNEFASMGKNTPFDGYTVTGKVVCTIVSGKVVYSE